MKRIMVILVSIMFLILLTTLISAEIIISQQNNLYNLGDSFSVPTTIKTNNNIIGFFQMFLLCNNQLQEFYKEYVILSAGEEKNIDPTILLVESLTGGLSGICKIKATLGGEYVLSNEFSISNLLFIELTPDKVEFAPEETITIEGIATKENGEIVDGFIEINIVSQNISFLDTVNNGLFSVSFSMPKDTPARQYLLNSKVYEKDQEGNITNQGFIDYTIRITQVPTSLEIAYEEPYVEPGTPVRVRAILHDQTGEKIESVAIITIKNADNAIMEQVEKLTDKFLEFPIAYNEPPSKWSVFAISNGLTAESAFSIKEKEKITLELVNKTLILRNVGNVLYNKTILVKIGDESLNINAFLEVDEAKKYTLTAPDGEYNIEVITDGESRLSDSVFLTGKVINIKETSRGIIEVVRKPYIWIFIIAIFGFVAFMVARKGYKKSFIGGPVTVPKPGSKTKIGSKKATSTPERDEKILEQFI